MTSPPKPAYTPLTEIDYVGEIKQLWENTKNAPTNLRKNAAASFTSLTFNGAIRLIVIVGAYILVRPYLVKLGAKMQGLDLDAANAARVPTGRVSANVLRGAPVKEESESEEETETTGADWGKKARKRQRQLEKKKKQEVEKRLAEEQEELEDKELEEFLLRNANYEGNPNPHNLTLDD
ncbi:hypothetical protein BP6252_01209 [Coleophoma cylindrospora]|uniref:DUF1531-domain-containing protein n=1 Tax=Coleophoma cylindrospora TaxID=1849047 RepID=A0A3D8SS99_9HELO|nr:hypothetical protein BP6252_01209 [Coleophoma cylindrospora]